MAEPNREGLFRDRTPAAAAQQLAIVLVWLAECELATYERLETIKRSSKHQLGRHKEIGDKVIEQLADLNVPADTRGLFGRPCPRVRERLTDIYARRGKRA